jgi:hypothetical protein
MKNNKNNYKIINNDLKNNQNNDKMMKTYVKTMKTIRK